MCTLTWWDHHLDGYEIFFNRDERRTRLPAHPPSEAEENGVRYLAPRDGNSGGTWMLVNEYGLTLCILNFYEKETPQESAARFRSRGLLLTSLANCQTGQEVDARLRKEEMGTYRAFTMMAFHAGTAGLEAFWWQWDGENLRVPDQTPAMPICSSSFQPEDVITGRKQRLHEMAPLQDSGDLDRFHHWDNDGQPSAFTVRMKRDDARTWSISRILVGPTEVSFRYEEVPEEERMKPGVHEISMARNSG